MLQPVYELVKSCETEISENSERQMFRADKQRLYIMARVM